jgi:hypothetical protein
MPLPSIARQALLLLLCAVCSPGQSPPSLLEAAAKVGTKLQGTIPNVPVLEVDQLGGLRQDAFSIQESLSEPLRLRKVDFFEVFPATYAVVEGQLQATTVSLDAEPTWLVAFDEESREWFFLYGFPEATTVNEFNRLAQALGIEVKNEQAALDLFDFYLKIAKGPTYRSAVPSDELSLQAIVSKDYGSRYSVGQRMANFKRWWERTKAARRGLAPPKALHTGERFDVKFFRYTQDELLNETVSFTPSGAVVVGPR